MNPSSVLGKLIVISVITLVLGCDAKEQTSGIDSTVDAAVSDAAVSDAAVSDAALYDATVSDQMLDAADMGVDMAQPINDAEIIDASTPPTPDMSPEDVDAIVNEMTPDAGSPAIPGPCVDNEALSCTQLCDTLTTCFSDSNCLGFENDDQTAVLEACVSSCGFNSSTREILCQSTEDSCMVILDRLFMADEALGTLCSGNFSPEDRQACTDICSRTSECTNGGNTMVETEQSCRFQCLLQGAASVSDCISALACDENFEGQVQACLQGRAPQPPLLTTCSELCDQLGRCEPTAFNAIGATTTPATCVQECTARLSTPASIACAGMRLCDLTFPLAQACEDENVDAPTCEIGCLRVLECSEESNPFGASDPQLQQCVSNCSADATLEERRCSFDVSCTPDFLENFYSCIENSGQ